MNNLNEQISDIEGDSPSRHAKRMVESMIADHVADAMAIEYVAMDRYESIEGSADTSWASLGPERRKYWLIEAKLTVLAWLNREQGTDYHLED